MIEIERVIINEKDHYLEIPLDDVVDDFMVTFYIRTGTGPDEIKTVSVSKDLLQAHMKYTGAGLVCKVPLSQIL